MAKKRKFYKRLLIVPVASFSLLGSISYADTTKPLKIFQNSKSEEGYTINFNNVTALELLKFISKISNTNFIYNPDDLQFTVTFTSEEPTSLENIMTAFTQILRIHGLSIIEESNNMMIHKNPEVKQITSIITNDKSLNTKDNNFLITRVFNIHNANPRNLEAILSSMMSAQAVIISLMETRQIIIVDLVTNVEKAAELISYLDVPSSNLDMRSYKFQNATAENSALLLNQIITPLSEGNPVIIVPQEETNTLFVVTTPYLLQRSMDILMQLDQVSKKEDKTLTLDKIFLYKIKYKSFSNIQKALKEIIDNSQKQGYDVTSLAKTVNDAKFISTTNSIVFVGEKSVLEKIKSLVDTIDDSPDKASDNNKFFIYEPKNKPADQVYQYLKEIEKHLVASHLGDPNLITTLETMKVVPSSNTIIFTGNAQSIEEVQTLLKTIDFSQFASKDQFLIYTPIYLSPQTLMESLKQVSKKLSSGGLADPELLKTIDDAKYVPSSYAIIFTGSQETLVKVKKLMDELDTVNKRTQLEDNMLIYKLKYISKKNLDHALDAFAETLPIDSPIHDSIEQRSFLPQSNSVIFKGNQQSLDRIKQIVDITDTPTEAQDQIFMYKIKNADDSVIIDNLKSYTSEMSSQDPLYSTLTNYKYIPASHLIIFKGTPDVLKEVELLMTNLDNLTQTSIQVLNYKVQSADFKTVLENLKKVQERLPKSDPMYLILKNAQVVESSHLIIFKGPEASITNLKDLLSKIDIKEQDTGEFAPVQIMYNLKNSSGKQMMQNLEKLYQKLKKDPQADPSLLTTLNDVQLIEDSNSILVSGPKKDVDQTLQFVAKFDVAEQENKNAELILNYKIKNPNADDVVSKLKLYTDNLNSSEPLYTVLKSVKFVPSSNLLIFKGTQANLDAVNALMTNFDTTLQTTPDDTPVHIIYTLKSASGDSVMKYLDTIKSKIKKDKNFPDQGLLQTIQDAEWVPNTNTIYLSGPKKDVDQVLAFIGQIDVPGQEKSSLVYKLNFVSGEKAIAELKTLAKTLKDPNVDQASLNKTIDSIEWVRSSNSLFIAGKKADLDEINIMLQGIDTKSSFNVDGANSEFFIYKPQHVEPKELKKSLDKFTADLENSNLADPILLQTLKSVKFSDHNQALVITGNEQSIKKVREILSSIDIPNANLIQANFFSYKAQHMQAKDLKAQLLKIVENISADPNIHDPVLINMIQNAQVISSSNSLLFTGNEESVVKVKKLLESIDTITPQDLSAMENSNFFIYKPTKVSAKSIKKNLDIYASDFEKTGLSDSSFIRSIKTAKISDNGSSLVFTGNPETITKVKNLLETIDVSSTDGEPANTHFILYRAMNQPVRQVQDTLLNIATDLEKSGLSDPRLIATIRASRVIDASSSIAFTGDEATLEKVKQLTASIDVTKPEQNIQHIGQTTFMIYKIKVANPTQLMESLKAIAQDLNKSKAGDPDLIKTIDNMRFVSDTNSIVFTGPAGTLQKISTILEKFDVPSEAIAPPQRISAEDYSLYEPKYVQGDELIKLTQDFEASLKSTGVKDHRLSDCVMNLKYLPKTSSIIVSGDKETIAKVLSLLEKFDAPSKVSGDGKLDSSIETIDELSFLIYKVQYHDGNSIVDAVQGIGDDLKNNPSPTTQALVSAIRSLQVVKITNSLIATGDSKALTRLKELIQSIDVPLKQVFIEVLVIETDFTNLLQFGLRWGAQGLYKNRLGFSTYSNSLSDANTNISFSPLIAGVNATTPPDPAKFPAPTGGSLGLIGDLIFHKGKTYVSLGDFVNAIQNDNDSTIVLNQKIITQDNRDTSIFVGQNIPYNGSVVTNSSNNTTISANIEYMDVGIKIDITPKVGEDDIITLDISQDLSESVSNPTGQQVNTVYGIQTRRNTLNTSVHVPDQHFVILSGNINNTTVRNKVAIPCLGGLPLIGAAFSDNISNKENTSVVIFIKPHVVNTYEEYKKITEKQEDLFRSQSSEEEFDQALEFVKSPDDR
jgi:type II secretory pathway component GspD/PulD (secretin)